MREIRPDLILKFRKLTSAMFLRSERAIERTKPLKTVLLDG